MALCMFQMLSLFSNLGNKLLFFPHSYVKGVKPGGRYQIPICWCKLSQSLSIISNLVPCRIYTQMLNYNK